MGIIEKLGQQADTLKKPAPHDETSKEVMTKPEVKQAKEFIRTLGNVRVTAEAQRVYNPALPPTKPKGPTAAQTELGTSANLQTSPEQGWGSTNA